MGKEKYKALYEEMKASVLPVEQDILERFRIYLKSAISSTLTGLSAVASGAVKPQHSASFTLFLTAVWQIPIAGSGIADAFQIAASTFLQKSAKNITTLLGGVSDQDMIADIFCYQVVAYHRDWILSTEEQQENTPIELGKVDAAVEKIRNFVLAVSNNTATMPVWRWTIIEKLLRQFMEGLKQVVSPSDTGKMPTPKEIADYLTEIVMVVKEEKLTPQLAVVGNFTTQEENTKYQIALDALRLSLLSYEDKFLITRMAKKWGYFQGKSFFYLLQDGFRCVGFANDDSVLCIFRGTDNFANVVADLQKTSKKMDGIGTIYTGFANPLEALWSNGLGLWLDSQTDKNLPRKHFLFTGHSLGGALAVLGMLKFLSEHKDNRVEFLQTCAAITFAQPAIGVDLPADADSQIHRFVHPADPIFSRSVSLLAGQLPRFGVEYVLPEENEVFDWGKTKHHINQSIRANFTAHSLLDYQKRLLAHAHNYGLEPCLHTSSTIIDAWRTPEGQQAIKRFLETFSILEHPDTLAIAASRMRFNDSEFLQADFDNQLTFIQLFSRSLIQDLCESGGRGFTPSAPAVSKRLKRWLDKLKINKQLGDPNLLAGLIAGETLYFWLQIAMYQAKDVEAFRSIFSDIRRPQNGLEDEIKFLNNCLDKLNKVFALEQDLIEAAPRASLVLIQAIQQMPELNLQKVDALRHVLAQRLCTDWLVQVAQLDLLFRLAHITKDIWSIMVGKPEILAFTYWLHYPYASTPEKSEQNVSSYLKNIIAQLQISAPNDLVLQVLTTINLSSGENNLLQALEAVSQNTAINAVIRLDAKLKKHHIQVLPSLTRILEPNKAAVDIEANSNKLSAEDYVALGDLAELAGNKVLAKSAFKDAYHITQNVTEKVRIAEKIISLVWTEVDESGGKDWQNSLIYQEILNYAPTDLDATKELFNVCFKKAHEAFQTRLQAIGHSIPAREVSEALSRQAVLLQTPFNGTWRLTSEAIAAFETRASVDGSIHPVAQIGELYVKENPGLVGIAFAAWALARWLFLDMPALKETGLISVQPAKILRQGKPDVIVQLSPRVPGETVRALVDRDPDPTVLCRLDELHFGALMISSLLLNFFDGRDANFIFKTEGSNGYLVSIDNDQVLVRDDVQRVWGSSQLRIKNLIFCLAQMQRSIDPALVAHFTDPNFSSIARIRAWLYSLQYYNDELTRSNLFPQQDHSQLFERSNAGDQVILLAFFDPQTILQPFTKLAALCNLLGDFKEFSERAQGKAPVLSYQDILAEIRPKLAEIYQKAFAPSKRVLGLQARMNAVGGLTGPSLSSTSKIVEHSLGQSSNTYIEFIKTQRTPQNIVTWLATLKEDKALINAIVAEVLRGSMATFAKEEALQTLVLDNLDYTTFSPQLHQALMAAISPRIKSLIFRGDPHLTDYDLLVLIRRTTGLEKIRLINCSQIQGIYLHPWDLTGKLTEINWLQEWLLQSETQKELEIKQCSMIVPGFLQLLVRLAQLYPNFSPSISGRPPLWGDALVDYFAPLCPQLGLPIPTWTTQAPLQDPRPRVGGTEERFNMTHKVAWLPDGSLLGGGDNLEHWQVNFDYGYWDFNTLERYYITSIHALAVFPNGDFLIGTGNGRIEYGYKNRHGNFVLGTVATILQKVGELLVLSQDSFLSTNIYDGCNQRYTDLQYWERKENTFVCQWSFKHAAVSTLTKLPDGSVITAGYSYSAYKNVIQHWRYEQQQKAWICLQTINALACHLAAFPDGSFVSAVDNEIKLWRMVNGHFVPVFSDNNLRYISHLTIFSDESFVCGSSYEVFLLQKTGDTFKHIRRLYVVGGRGGYIKDLAISPNGELCCLLRIEAHYVDCIGKDGVETRMRVEAVQYLEYHTLFTAMPFPNIVDAREARLHNAIQLLKKMCLSYQQIPLLFPRDLLDLDVSNTPITDKQLEAILAHCTQLRLENINIDQCEKLSDAKRLTHQQLQSRRVSSSTSSPILLLRNAHNRALSTIDTPNAASSNSNIPK